RINMYFFSVGNFTWVQLPIETYGILFSVNFVTVRLCKNLVPVSPREEQMHWEERIENYVRETGFPKSLFISEDGRVVGTWIMGNDYRVKSAYYGGYPAGYLKRIRALFPDKKRVLHLFSGKVDLKTLPGDTVDVNPKLRPTYVDDAQSLKNVPLEKYDLVLADPPYSVE